jgi:hypothetical protein
MADPKVTSVDISRLQECNPDLMAGLQRPQLREKLQDVLKGSDLSVDEKTGEVIAGDKAQKVRDVAIQAETVRQYIKAAKGDNQITLDEAKEFIATHSEMQGIAPEAFLDEAKTFIEKRWGGICANLKEYSVEYPLQNLIDNLNLYNDGVYKEEFEQGRMSFSPIKSAANLSWFYNFPLFGLTPLEKSPLKAWDYQLGRETQVDATYLSGDNMSMEDAYNDHLQRQAAIIALMDKLNEDIKKQGDKGVAWHALSKSKDPKAKKTTAEDLLKLLGDKEITVKVERLDGMSGGDKPAMKSYEIKINGAEAAKILREQLAFEGLFGIVTTTDKKARMDKAIAFAQAERPGTAGLGGGNGMHREWDNLVTAEVNNHYFAKSLLEAVIREGEPEQQKVAGDLLYKEIMPAAEGAQPGEEGGGFLSQKILWGASELICGIPNLLGAKWHPIPYRAMPDEEAMYAPERLIRTGLFFYGGPKAIRGAETAKALASARIEAWRAAETTNVLQKGVLATVWGVDKAWAVATVRPARTAMMNWLTKGIENSAALSKGHRTMGWFGKGLTWLAAGYAFDEYLSPTSTDRYGPNLDTTARARIYTLDPLPPEGEE